MKCNNIRQTRYTIGEAVLENNIKSNPLKPNVAYKPLHTTEDLPNRKRSIPKIDKRIAELVAENAPFAESLSKRWNHYKFRAMKEIGGPNPLVAKAVHRRINRDGQSFITVVLNINRNGENEDGKPVTFEFPDVL